MSTVKNKQTTYLSAGEAGLATLFLCKSRTRDLRRCFISALSSFCTADGVRRELSVAARSLRRRTLVTGEVMWGEVGSLGNTTESGDATSAILLFVFLLNIQRFSQIFNLYSCKKLLYSF